MNLSPGFHRGVPMEVYLGMDAIGSTHLSWLKISPLHYAYQLGVEREDTEATGLGTAVHTAVLEPEEFRARYVCEPDPHAIAPTNASPRATNAYKAAVKLLRASGRIVLKRETMEQIDAMADAVRSNPHIAKLLTRAPEREVTMVWERDGHLCRGRGDAIGDGVLADLKTTRSLARFSPFEFTKFGYYRQQAWYLDGAKRLGREFDHVLMPVVESTPPYDVALFAVDSDGIAFGHIECDELMEKLAECERTGHWPGMFPEIQRATVTDWYAAEMASEEVA